MSDITRTLLESDAWCPSCGHNRNTSSVSSVECLDGSKQCQMCCARWNEVVRPDLTPLTDAVAGKSAGRGLMAGDYYAMLDHARRLERELQVAMVKRATTKGPQ